MRKARRTPKQRPRAVEEVTYNAADHREYVTGFHRRKEERRQKALEELAEKERKERIARRKEKRLLMQKTLRTGTEPDDESEGEAAADDGATVEGAPSGTPAEEDHGDTARRPERKRKPTRRSEREDGRRFKSADGKGVVKVTVEALESPFMPVSPPEQPAVPAARDQGAASDGPGQAKQRKKPPKPTTQTKARKKEKRATRGRSKGPGPEKRGTRARARGPGRK